MNAKTRRAALEAASRVALGALSLTSLASCGGKTVDGYEFEAEPADVAAPTPTQPAPVASTPLPTSPPTLPMDAGSVPPPAPEDAGTSGTCIGPVPLNSYFPEPPTISDAAFECCLTRVLQYGASEDPQYENCCAAVIVGVDQDYTRWQRGDMARHCCYGRDQNLEHQLWSYSLCAPWGPPVPPSLPPELGGVA